MIAVLLCTNVGYGQSNQCATVPAGLIGWWSAEGNANDFTGQHSGTFPYGSAFAVGEAGQAFDFDGSYRRVSIPDSPAFQLTNAMTLEAWVYPRAYGGFLTFRGDNRGGLDTWTLDTYDTGFVKFQIDDEANNYEAVRAPLALNQWQHVAATWDRASGAMKIYVNGTLAQQTNTTVIPIGVLDSGSEPGIGIGNHGGTFHQFPFNGLVDELGIYGRALSDAEVAGIFAAGSAGKCSANNTPTNPPPATCVTPPAGLVATWRAEGDAVDGISGATGALENVTFTSGKVGQAFVFNPASGQTRVAIPDRPEFALTNSLSIEGWIRPTGPGGWTIFWRGDNRGGLDPYFLQLNPDEGNILQFIVEQESPNTAVVLSTTPLAYNQWYHIAATLDDATGLMRIYTNGVVAVQTNTSIRPFANLVASADASIGIGNLGEHFFDHPFVGNIDEISLYSRALSQAEVQSIYAADSAGKCATGNPPVTTCAPVPSGAVGWWPAEGNTGNAAGTNVGVLAGGLGFAPGKVGQAFSFNDSLAAVRVPASLELNVGAGAGLTLEAWINPTDVSQAHALFEWNDATYWGVHFFIAPGQPTSGSPGPAGPGQLYANVVDSFGGWHQMGTSAGVVTNGIFQHVALTYDKASGAATIYRNGEIVSQLNLGSFTPLTTQDLYLGRRQAPSGEAGSFAGLLDEPTVYDRALGSNEIAAIYAAGNSGKCSPGLVPPVITQQPQSVTTNVGATVRFEVQVTSIPGLTFQWFFGNDSLANQTNATLILSNVQPVHAGTYSVRVANNSSAVSSSNAVLTIDLTQPAMLVDADSFGFYNDALGTTLDGTAPQFPLPIDAGGGDPEFFPAEEPNLAAGTAILGSWLTNPAVLNTNWRSVAPIPTTWELNTETAIIYAVDGGDHGISNVRADIDADNGIYVWVNGRYKFGARQPGLPSPLGQYEYTNIFLGELVPGSNYIQILREDSGIADGYQFRLRGNVLATNQPPIITQSPATQSIAGGSTITFNAAAIGSPDLTFQWQFNGNSIAGQSNTSLTLANVQLSQAGGYAFVASNAYGSATSSVATLTVLAFPPFITRQPTNVTAIETTTASFSVQATGSVTLTYQWWFNNAPLPGRTAASLTLTGVQFGNAGDYSVVVANQYGAVTSSVATLTVNPRPPCASASNGLVSWWRAESNALDGWNTNNGQFLFAKYVPGKVGLAFSQPLVHIPDAPSLRFTNAMTFEAWINPSSLAGSTPRTIISKSDYPFDQSTRNSFIFGTTNSGQLFFTVSPNGSYRTNTSVVTTDALLINQWSHVAATYDGTSLRIFINGTVAAERNYTNGIFPGSLNLSLGGISSLQAATSSPWQFSGLVDEASLYNRALSAAEIHSIFAADLTGKCLAPPLVTQQPQSQAVPLGEDVKLTANTVGSRPLTYRWRFNGTNILNATNAHLVIEKVQTNNVGFYTLAVTNSAGFDVSLPAEITLLPAPACTGILPGLISWWTGDTNLLDVMGLNNIATYSPASYPTGKVASAFTFNGVTSRVVVNNNSSLNFGINANFSIEMWIKANATNTTYPNVPLFEKRDAVTVSWKGYSLSLYNGQIALGLGAVNIGTNGLYISSGPDLRDGMFHHVAVTLNRTASNGGVLYVDGSPVLVFDPRALANSLLTSSPLYLGAPTVTLSNSYFAGLIDEPAIYNRALTAAEILSIRAAGAAGRCKAAPLIVTQPVGGSVIQGSNFTLAVFANGNPTPRYQWRRNTVPLSGATNATLNLINFTAANVGTYSVVVSNAFGTVISSNAVLALNRLPIANADALSTPSNTPAVFPAAKLMLNDTDPDGDVLMVISVSNNSSQNGSVSLASGMVTYSPPANFVGNDTFTYTIADGRGGTAVGTVMATVGNGGAAPLNIVFGPTVEVDQFVVRFAGIPGLTYTIEAAPTPNGPWSKVANLTAPSTDTGFGIGVFEFRETVTGEKARYYRTVYPSY